MYIYIIHIYIYISWWMRYSGNLRNLMFWVTHSNSFTDSSYGSDRLRASPRGRHKQKWRYWRSPHLDSLVGMQHLGLKSPNIGLGKSQNVAKSIGKPWPNVCYTTFIFWLVIYLPLWKNDGVKVSWDDEIPNMMGKTCSKAPTSIDLAILVYIHTMWGPQDI